MECAAQRKAARAAQLPSAVAPIAASDRDAGAVEATLANAERAGVAADIEVRQCALSGIDELVIALFLKDVVKVYEIDGVRPVVHPSAFVHPPRQLCRFVTHKARALNLIANRWMRGKAVLKALTTSPALSPT